MTFKYIDSVREQIAAAEQDRSALEATIAHITEQRDQGGRKAFTPGQLARVDAAQAEINDLDVRLDAMRAREAELEVHEQRANAAKNTPTRAPRSDRRAFAHDGDLTRMSSSDLRARALTACEELVASDQVREAAARAVERAYEVGGEANQAAMSAWAVASGDPHYFAGFAEMCRNGNMAILTDEQKAAFQRAGNVMRAMGISAGAAGAFGIPLTLDPSIVLSNSGFVDPMRRIADVKLIATDRWKGVTSAGVVSYWHSEGAISTTSEPTLVQPDIPVHGQSTFVPFSYEVGQDYGVDLVNELGRIAADSAADLEAAAFWTGTGTGQPSGLVTLCDASTNVEVVVTTDGALGRVDIYKVANALGDRFWGRASWAGNRTTWNQVRSLSDDNVAFWAPSLGADRPENLLGKPVYDASDIPPFTGTTGASNLLVVGDFSHYKVIDRISMVTVIPDLFDTTNNLPTATRGFYMFRRVGGSVDVLNAFRLLQNA